MQTHVNCVRDLACFYGDVLKKMTRIKHSSEDSQRFLKKHCVEIETLLLFYVSDHTSKDAMRLKEIGKKLLSLFYTKT